MTRLPLPNQKSHRITVQDVLMFCKNRWETMTSATTVDRTQRKHLNVAVNEEGYRVQRRYFGGNGQWETIFEGRDLEEAVRVYNRLS